MVALKQTSYRAPTVRQGTVIIVRTLAFVLATALAGGAEDSPAQTWKPLEFLAGEWTGEGAGAPGQSVGDCSFTFDLRRNVLIRKSYAQYPTSRHDDLMIVYLEKDLKAIYFDTEGHVIHYTVETTPASVKFVSDQFRLTYKKTSNSELKMDFEISGSNYLHATLRKK